MATETHISEHQPLTREERRRADRERLDRLDRCYAEHEQSLKERDLSELRRLESLPTRDWSDEGRLAFLKRKHGR